MKTTRAAKPRMSKNKKKKTKKQMKRAGLVKSPARFAKTRLNMGLNPILKLEYSPHSLCFPNR